MSNTFSKIYLHIVFSTKDRLNLINDTSLFEIIPLLWSGNWGDIRIPRVKTPGYSYYALSGLHRWAKKLLGLEMPQYVMNRIGL